jgi:hypothetical protein
MKQLFAPYLLALSSLVVAGVGSASALEFVPYGEKIIFETNSPLQFADFKLTFLGEHRVTPPQYPRGWLVYEFRVVQGGESLLVSWSAGLGDISPSPFTVSGKQFFLELAFSNTLGQLKKNELVITKSPGKN